MCKGPWTDELSLVELILAKKFSGALVLEVQRGVRAVSATTVLFLEDGRTPWFGSGREGRRCHHRCALHGFGYARQQVGDVENRFFAFFDDD